MPVQGYNTFSQLKSDIERLGVNISTSVLKSLIEEFDSVINSKRRSSLIHSCGDLISVLEKRAYVDSDNYTPLKRIVECLPSTPERDMILARFDEEPSRSMPFTPNNNYYAPRQQGNMFASVNASPQYTQRVSYELSNHPEILPEAVIEHISDSIGSKWRDMARKLKLREGDIHRIKEQYGNDSYQCAYHCLTLYQGKCERYELERNLLSALEKVRRVDLRNQVQKILNRRNL